jgi:hypothetical protein
LVEFCRQVQPEAAVNWNGNPATAIDTLDGAGTSPTLRDDRIRETFLMDRERKSFDPKSPHFEIILISLLDSPYFPQYERKPEGDLPPILMDRLRWRVCLVARVSS